MTNQILSVEKPKESIFNQEFLDNWLKDQKIPSFRKKQIYTDIFTNSLIDFQEMTTLPLELRDKLSETFQIIPFVADSVHDNPDSTKVGFALPNGSIIEAVIMYHYHEKEVRMLKSENVKKERFLNRVTLCISSQVGCPV
jgi:23S rRNA (adenine2503-C2)-methyltransferase